MANTKITSHVIEANAILSTHIASGAITSGHLSSITSDNVSEGSTNVYHTAARARGTISVTGGNLAYDSSTGVLQLTDAEIRDAISATSSGDGSLTYTSSTGVIAYTGPTASQVQAHLSAGTGVTYSSGAISIGQAVGTSDTVVFGNITTAGYLRGPTNFTIDPAGHGDNTGTLIVAGNLQVDGTTTTINSTTLTVDDLNITLASGAADSAAANGAGITVDGASATLTYASAGDNWAFNKNLDVTGNIAVSGTVDGVDIAARDGVLTTTTTTAGAALPKAGGTMTGALTINAGTNAIPLTIGSSSAINFIQQRWKTSLGDESYILSYGGNHSSEAGNFAIKNTRSGGEIFFGLASSVEPLRLTSTGATFAGNIAVSGTVDGIDIAARDAVLTSTTTTAGAALPKAGGTMTGNLTFNKEDPNITLSDSSTSRTLSMFVDNNNSVVRASGPLLLQVGSQSALTIDTSRNSVFAGNLDVTGTITGDDGLSIQGGAGNAYLQVGSNTGSWTWKNYQATHKLALEDSDGTGEVLNFDTSGNATFAGTISSGAITSTAFGSQLATTLFQQNVIKSSVASQQGAFIRMAVSSAANPTYAWEDDTDTGMYRTSSNALALGVGGVGRLFISSSGNATFAGTISSGAITSTGILTLDTSPAANGTGDLVIIPSLSSSSGVGFAGQVFGVNIKNAVHSTHNAPQVSNTWGGVTGATAIAIQADDNTYGQFQVWTAPQDSSADDLLTPKFYIAGSGNATFAGTISSGNISVGSTVSIVGSGSSLFPSLKVNNNGYLGSASVTDALQFKTSGDLKAKTKLGVGIDPVEMLDIKSASGDARIRLDAPSGSDTEIKFFNAGVAQYTVGHDDATDNFVIGGANVDAPHISITKDGDVGLGTSAPNNSSNRNTLALQGAWGGELLIQVGTTTHARFGTDNSSSGSSCRVQSADNIVFKTGSSANISQKLNSDGYASFYRAASEYGMELKSAGSRSGLVIKKPATDSVMGSLLVLTDESYRLGTAGHYHLEMLQNGYHRKKTPQGTYFTITKNFTCTGNAVVNNVINLASEIGASTAGSLRYEVAAVGYGSGGTNGVNAKYSVSGYSGHSYSGTNYGSFGAGTIQNGYKSSNSTSYDAKGISYHPCINMGSYIANGEIWAYVPAGQQYGFTVSNNSSNSFGMTIIITGFYT